jgi:hypothetical protein
VLLGVRIIDSTPYMTLGAVVRWVTYIFGFLGKGPSYFHRYESNM